MAGPAEFLIIPQVNEILESEREGFRSSYGKVGKIRLKKMVDYTRETKRIPAPLTVLDIPRKSPAPSPLTCSPVRAHTASPQSPCRAKARIKSAGSCVDGGGGGSGGCVTEGENPDGLR